MNCNQIYSQFKDWLKSNKTFFREDIIEESLLSSLLAGFKKKGSDVPYALDIFPFDCSSIEYDHRLETSPYKAPLGPKVDSIEEGQALTIKITGGRFILNSLAFMPQPSSTAVGKVLGKALMRGESMGIFDTMIFQFLTSHQREFPIVLQLSKGVYPVYLTDYHINEGPTNNTFNATLKRTAFHIFKPSTLKGKVSDIALAVGSKVRGNRV